MGNHNQASHENHRGNILIVDDNPSNLGALFNFLKDSGFRVLVATDGEGAIEQINYEYPDLILLDVMMPGIDGFETCRRIKANHQTVNIPVIFLTALSEVFDKIKGFQVGGVDYITKPIQQEEVLARVETHLTIKRLQESLQDKNLLLQKEIEERKRIEGELRQSEAKYRTLVEQIPAVTYIAALDDLSTKLYVSPRIQKMLGFSATEWQQKSDLWLKQIHPEDCQRVLVDLYLSQNSGKPFCCEYRLLAKSGHVVWVHDEASLVRDDKGHLISFQGVMFDISEHIQLEKDLSNTQIFLSSIVENLPVGVFVKNGEDLSFCLWNKTCENMFGYSADAVLSKTDGQVFPTEQAKAFMQQDRQVLQKRELLEIACESVDTLNNGLRSLHTKKIPLIDEKTNQINYLLGISEDITEKVEAENALRTSEAKNRALLNAIPDLMYCINAEGVLTEYMASKDQPNKLPELSELSNLSENSYLHKNITEVFSDELADWIMHHVKEALVSGKVQRGEYMQELDGQWHCYDARFFAIHQQATAENISPAEQQVLVIVRDISENKQLASALMESQVQLRNKTQQLEQTLIELQSTQSQLIHNAKMVGLGQLVAGIAHEINNPINFIYGNVSHATAYTEQLLDLLMLYQENYPQLPAVIAEKIEEIDLEFVTEDFQQLLQSMKNGAERIRNIILSLRTFSHLDEAEKKRVDLHECIDSVLLVLHHRLATTIKNPGIQVIKEYDRLPLVECYPGELNQVFLNIIGNAIDALQMNNSDDYTLDPNDSSSPATTKMIKIQTSHQDQQIIIKIADNGGGIDENIHNRIFDPFFTTKPVGSGTGLGLFVSHHIIVKKHQGQLSCVSTPGQGVEFTIVLAPQLPIN